MVRPSPVSRSANPARGLRIIEICAHQPALGKVGLAGKLKLHGAVGDKSGIQVAHASLTGNHQPVGERVPIENPVSVLAKRQVHTVAKPE